MNLPNKLTIVRILMVPLFLFFGLFVFPGEWGANLSRLLAAVTFAAAAIKTATHTKILHKIPERNADRNERFTFPNATLMVKAPKASLLKAYCPEPLTRAARTAAPTKLLRNTTASTQSILFAENFP